jgi:2,3-bisphosphoglycerate-independent phosphoglycerate mutase
MRLLFLFLDGVGLGPDNPNTNPLAAANMPNMRNLLSGQRLLIDKTPLENDRATLLALDACLGIDGRPQSATGQAVLLTGYNIPAALGYHYGPKPNPAVASFLQNGNLFSTLRKAGKRSALLNAYPPRFFEAIQSRRRMYSAIPMAVTSAGIPLKTIDDLYAGKALSADFTGQGWRTHLNQPDTPLYDPRRAGEKLAALAQSYDLAFFEYWWSDYVGHAQDLAGACQMLEQFDEVMGGLLADWDDRAGLILLTSDHGNMEDLGTAHHTRNPVPGLLIGDRHHRQAFAKGLHDLTGVTPAIRRLILT